MGLRANIAESLEIEPDSVTESFVFILGTFLLYMLMLGIDMLPGIIGTVIAVLFLVFWLGFPFALHYDRKFVAGNSDWNPSRWYYLGFLPGYLGIAFVIHYIYRRREIFGTDR